MSRGFYIGRFQPYHNGHHHVIERIAAEVEELVVAVGSAGDSHSKRDPFTAGERVMMLNRVFADLDLITYVVPIEDLNRNPVWVSHIESMCPQFDVAYSNNPLVVRLFEERGISVEQVPMHNREVLEGTEIRRRMIQDDDWQSLVPDAVEHVIGEVDGTGRIREVSDSDGAESTDTAAASASDRDDR